MRPLVLLSGFLGAGKTSCLRHLLSASAQQGRRLAVLVNEFAPAGVDGERLDLPEGQLTEISGGSIFCHCRATTFIQVLGELAARHDVDGILVEASGLADPAGVPGLLAEAGLDDRLMLHRVICLVDPGTFARVRATLPAIERQVAIADLIAVNHVDRFSDAEVADTVAQIQASWPGRAVAITSYGELAEDPFAEPVSSLERDPELTSASAAADFTHLILPLTRAFAFEELTGLLAPLVGSCPRIKGTVVTAEGPLRIDLVGSEWLTRPGAPEDRSRLVIIAPHSAAEQVLTVARAILSVAPTN